MLLPKYIKDCRDYIILDLYIQPASKVTQISGVFADSLKIKISSLPIEGKANQAVISFLAKLLLIPRSQIRVISGNTSRYKRVRVDGLAIETVLVKLSFE